MTFTQIVLIVFISQLFLWAARGPMHRFLHGAGQTLAGLFRLLSQGCRGIAARLRKKNNDLLLEGAREQALGKIEHEFRCLDATFPEDLATYAQLQRRLDDVITSLEADYRECGQAPPEAPGWTEAVQALRGISQIGDKGARKVLEELHRAAVAGDKKALAEFRSATSDRHKILSGMAPKWKEIKNLSADMGTILGRVMGATERIDHYAGEYQSARDGKEASANSLARSAVNLFVISAVVLLVAAAGGFINFHLIALPMSELVPAGARISGVPVSNISALVIVLMEVTAGIFMMEMLGVTKLFPRLHRLDDSRRRLILGIAVAGLFILSCTEASLAIVREHLVETEALVLQSLAGAPEGGAEMTGLSSWWATFGQAALGFVLPWVLAVVAIPLEMLIISSGTVWTGVGVGALGGFGHVMRLVGHVLRHAFWATRHLYDAYISIPLQIEKLVRGKLDPALPATKRRKSTRTDTKRSMKVISNEELSQELSTPSVSVDSSRV